MKQSYEKNILIFLFLFLSTLSIVCEAEDLTIVFTGELDKVFHPISLNESEIESQVSRLDSLLGKIRKKHPDAVFVDTGNYLDLIDYGETIYNAPALSMFRKYNYNAINVGGNELLSGIPGDLFEDPETMSGVQMVTAVQNAETDKYLADSYTDIYFDEDSSLRVMGYTENNFECSAPDLVDVIDLPDASIFLSTTARKEPQPDLTVLLADLAPEHIRHTASLEAIDLVLASNSRKDQDPIQRIDGNVTVHRTEPGEIGILHMKIADEGKIDKIRYDSYNIYYGKRKFLGIIGKRKRLSPPPAAKPIIGKLIENERILKQIKVPYDSYQIERLMPYSSRDYISNQNVYSYLLYRNQVLVGKALFVDYILGEDRPQYLYWIILDDQDRLYALNFLYPPYLSGWQTRFPDRLRTYKGLTWDELTFDASGCGGAEEEFRALYDSLYLAMKMAAQNN